MGKSLLALEEEKLDKWLCLKMEPDMKDNG